MSDRKSLPLSPHLNREVINVEDEVELERKLVRQQDEIVQKQVELCRRAS